jgi:hypothetical protein
MKARPLSQTNPHLKDPAKMLQLVARSVRTSGAVEGIKTVGASKAADIEIPRRKERKIYQTPKLIIPSK